MHSPVDHNAAAISAAAAAAAAAGQAATEEAASAAEAEALEASLAANTTAAEATAAARATAIEAVRGAESAARAQADQAVAAADAKSAAARKSGNWLLAATPAEREVKVTEVTGGMANGEVKVDFHAPAVEAQKHGSAASLSAQFPDINSDGSSDTSTGNGGDASGESVQPSNKAAVSLVQVTDGDSEVQDGEVMVNVAPDTTEDQDPVKTASTAIEITEGKTDTLDGNITVTVAEPTKAEEASVPSFQGGTDTSGRETDGSDTDGSDANGSKTKANVAPSKAGGESGTSFVIVTDGDATDAGSEVDVSIAGDSTAAAGGSDSPAEGSVKGNMAAQEQADDGNVEIMVDKSLLG